MNVEAAICLVGGGLWAVAAGMAAINDEGWWPGLYLVVSIALVVIGSIKGFS